MNPITFCRFQIVVSTVSTDSPLTEVSFLVTGSHNDCDREEISRRFVKYQTPPITQWVAGSQQDSVKKIRATLLNTENPLTDFEMIRNLFQELLMIGSEEAAKVLIDYLATPRGAELRIALNALMSMKVPHLLKIAGIQNLARQKDPIISPIVMERLKKMNGEEADRLLAEIANPKSGYTKKMQKEGAEETKKRDSLKATEYFQEAVKKNPTNVEACYYLGSAYYDVHQWDEAIEILKTVLRLKKDHYPAHFLLADSYREMGELDKALQHYARIPLDFPLEAEKRSIFEGLKKERKKEGKN